MTSGILIGSNPDNPRIIGAVATSTEPAQPSDEEKARQLPQPSGYHILCAIPAIDKEFESGLLKADITIRHEEVLSTVLFVIELGPDCYKDTTKFPTGAWCKKGDFVLVRPNSGSRLIIHDKEFRLINDDTVEAVVQDPRGISRK